MAGGNDVPPASDSESVGLAGCGQPPSPLPRADAIVLFDWLKTVDLNDVPIAHPAEKQALADLLTRLEHETDIPGVAPGRH